MARFERVKMHSRQTVIPPRETLNMQQSWAGNWYQLLLPLVSTDRSERNGMAVIEWVFIKFYIEDFY
jgi:hypothetical protein